MVVSERSSNKSDGGCQFKGKHVKKTSYCPRYPGIAPDYSDRNETKDLNHTHSRTKGYKSNLYIRTENYSNTYVVGDIHGDIMVYLEFLKVAKCTSDDTLLNRLITYHKDYSNLKSRHMYNDFNKYQGLDQITWAVGCRNLIVFAGDVLDNWRGSPCPDSMSDSGELLILESMYRLQNQAAKQHGRVVHIIGNHELGNIINNIRCPDYTASSNCKQNEFSEARSESVKSSLIKLSSVVAIAIDNTLICHGGISSYFMDRHGVDLVYWNNLYWEYILYPESREKSRLYDNIGTNDLTWYRPTTVQEWDPMILKKIKLPHGGSIDYMIVAHTMFNMKFEKNNNLNSCTYSEFDIIPSKHIFMCDFGMSRAFTRTHTPGVIGCLQFNKVSAMYNTKWPVKYIMKRHPDG